MSIDQAQNITYTKESLLQVRPLFILTGPTSVGKTASSIGFAKAIGGEIISADSMQVYRGCDIGSAKILPEEMQGIPHYLIDAIDPKDEFNVMIFQQMAKAAVSEIYEHGHVPIVVGGTGFYIQALLYDIEFTAEDTSGVRRALEREMAEKGALFMHEKLRSVDPESAKAIPVNNLKRVIRALEYFHVTGEKISVHNETQRQKTSPYAFRYYCLNRAREKLYARIEQRIDEMMEEGLLAEVTRLKGEGCTRDLVSMQGLGYKELLAYLDGECSLEEAVAQIKLSTRHFAKRQLTWFRREKDVLWIEKEEFANDDERIVSFLTEDAKTHVLSSLVTL